MKLRILPAHLRNKKRYLAFEVISETFVSREDVVSLIWRALWDTHGACGLSSFDFWVINIWKCKAERHHVMRGILRCKREELIPVRSVIPTITRFNNARIVFHTLGVSGSVHSAIEKFIGQN